MQKLLELLENNFKYLVAAILIIIPLYPKFPFIRIPGIYVSVRFEDFLILALAVITFIKIIPKMREFLKDSVIRAFLVFFLIGATSLISAVFLTKTADLGVTLLHLFRRVEYFIPFIAVFGLNEFAVRFPSALLGSLTILITYFLVKELLMSSELIQTKKRINTNLAALLSAFLFAISPWSLQFSRAAFEGNIGLFFKRMWVAWNVWPINVKSILSV